MPLKPASTKANNGFTLIEGLVVVAIISIVAAIAAPNLASWVVRSNISAIANDRTAAIWFARAEAASKRQSFSICASSNCGSATDWGNAVVVVQGSCSASPTVIRTFDSTYDGYTVTSSVKCLTYLPNGTTAAVGANIAISHPSNTVDNPVNRVICISTIGRPTLKIGGTC